MWKLETQDLGKREGFDLEAILTDDEDGWQDIGGPAYGVIIQAWKKGILVGTAAIWGVDGRAEDGTELERTLDTYGEDLIYEAIQEARATIEGITAFEEDE